MAIGLVSLAFKAQIPPAQKLVLLALCDCANELGECFPSVQTLREKSSLSERTVQGAIIALEKAGALTRSMRSGRATTYTVDPRRICGGTPPQDMHPRSICPPQELPYTPAAFAGAPAAAAPITVIQPSEKRKTPSKPKPKVIGYTEDFEAFYAAYPKKVGKVDAFDEWKKLDPDKILVADILEGVSRYIDSGRWDDKQFIPHPNRFLKKRRWEDEVDSGNNGHAYEDFAGPNCAN